MLLHLPIVFLVAVSPVAVSNTVPKFDIAKECRYEGGGFDRCSKDEATALEQLKSEWTRFVGADKSTCMGSATIDGSASYVELLICLQMASEVRNENNKSAGPHARTGLQPMGLGRPGPSPVTDTIR
jgi:hypothetical protein